MEVRKLGRQSITTRERLFYRYVRPDEAMAIESSNIMMTLSGSDRTWYSPDRYNTRREAQRCLALPNIPTHRVGPYPEDELPPWSVDLKRVAPNFGQPGGGWEAATDDPLYISGVVPLGDTQ